MARKMKDSGIEWIGEIPEGWSVSKVLHCLSMPITDGPHTTPILYDTGIPFVSAEAVSCGNGRIDFSHIRGYISEKFYKECCQKYIPEIDDIYMIKSGATTGRVAIVDTTRVFTIWSPLAVFRCNKDCILPKFLFYYLQSPAFQKEVEFGWTFGTQQNVGMRSLEQMKVCVPQLNKQDTIANYLDYQCSQIDLLLQKALTSIEEYKKLKQAVITQAVTKGVRGEREMKNCNIGWIKELPSDWGIIPSKYLFKNSDTKKINGDEQLTASQQHGIITQKYYTELTGSKVVLANKGLDDWKHVEPFDFIISLRSFQGGLEMSETTGCITWHYIVLKPYRQIYSYYYKWLFKSEIYIRALQRTCNFIRDGQDLRYSNFVQVPLFEPPLEEQKEIADYLNGKCAEIDGLIAKKEQLVKELESYKKSLIYEVVTGKREV